MRHYKIFLLFACAFFLLPHNADAQKRIYLKKDNPHDKPATIINTRDLKNMQTGLGSKDTTQSNLSDDDIFVQNEIRRIFEKYDNLNDDNKKARNKKRKTQKQNPVSPTRLNVRNNQTTQNSPNGMSNIVNQIRQARDNNSKIKVRNVKTGQTRTMDVGKKSSQSRSLFNQ